jgi:hypothetical protein
VSSYDYTLDPENRLRWHFFWWEDDEEREGVEYLTLAERVQWTSSAGGTQMPHVTYEEAAVIVHRNTDHPDSAKWREQKEALGARMVELLNLAETAVYVVDARGYDLPELYRFPDEEAAVEWCKTTGRYNDEDGIEPGVHVLGLSEASS